MIAGKTLVDHAIDCAEAATRLHWRIVVTSDDPAVLDLATARGAHALPRPAYLCGDTAGTIHAVVHALIHLRDWGDMPDAVCVLQPTNPLRLPEDIDGAIHTMEATGCGSVISHAPAHSHPQRQIWGDTLEPLMADYAGNAPRQHLRPVFDRDGSVYLSHVYWLRKGTFYAPDGRILLIPRERHLDIETEHDLDVARYLYSKRTKQGGTSSEVQDDRN